MKADGCSIAEAWTEKFVLNVFCDGFSICRGTLGSGLKKNWRVAALKYLRPVTYMPWLVRKRKFEGRKQEKKEGRKEVKKEGRLKRKKGKNEWEGRKKEMELKK